MKIIFLGTPDFSVPILQEIAKHHEIAAAVTQPDKPRDRGVISFSPVKECALKLNIPVLQFKNIRNEGVEVLRSYKADIMVTAAYGQILSEEILNIAPKGVINVHASLLPKYRGSSPIQWAIINGEDKTGITIMQTAPGIDTGDILLQKELPIGEKETAGELFIRLSGLGAKAVIEALSLTEAGKAERTVQDESKASYFPMLTKNSGKIDFNKTSAEVVNFVRGMTPWPSAKANNLKLFDAERAAGEGKPGEVLSAKIELVIACGAGAVKFNYIQAPGGKKMKAEEYLRGHMINENSIFN